MFCERDITCESGLDTVPIETNLPETSIILYIISDIYIEGCQLTHPCPQNAIILFFSKSFYFWCPVTIPGKKKYSFPILICTGFIIVCVGGYKLIDTLSNLFLEPTSTEQ
jgi:hypothetical protein